MRRRLGFGSAVAAITGLLFLFFGPGIMTPDTLWICNSVFGNQPIDDWHTAIFTALWRATQVPTWAVFVGQTLVLVGAILALLWLHLRARLAVLATITIVGLPATLGWFGVIGKDEWFAASIMAAMALLGWAERWRGRGRIAALIGVVAAMWLAAAARPSALVIVAGVLLLMWPKARRFERPALRWGAHVGTVIALCLAIALSQSLLSSVWIKPRVTHPSQVGRQNDLVVLSLRTGQQLLPASSVRDGATLEDFGEIFRYETPTDLYWDERSPLEMRTDNSAELTSAWISAIRAHPIDYVKHRTRMAAWILGIAGPHPHGTMVEGGGRGEDFGYTCPLPQPVSPALRSAALDTLRDVESTDLVRGWQGLGMLIVAAPFARLRTSSTSRGILIAGLMSIALFAAAGASITYRYSWFTMVCALLMTAIALANRAPLRQRSRPTRPNDELDDEGSNADPDDDAAEAVSSDTPGSPT